MEKILTLEAEVVTDESLVIDSAPEVKIDASKSVTAEIAPDTYVLGSTGSFNTASSWVGTYVNELVRESIGTGGTLADALNLLRTDVLDEIENGVNQVITQVENEYVSNSTLTTTLGSEIAGVNSAILNIENTYATQDQAQTYAVDAIKASFGGSADSSAIEAYIGNIAITQVDANSATAATQDVLLATLNDTTLRIDTLDSVEITPEGWQLASSKLAIDPNGNIVGWQFSNGSNELSDFTISADKFQVASGTSSAVPFSIDTTTQEAVFQGKVTFTSGGTTTTGTINEAITANIEQVQVGDKNINITDNLIPTTSLLTDINNAGYQFIGDPIKNADTGLDTFAEVQVTLDADDEVYSPYVDEMVYGYYYRFGTTGITDLSKFKIVTIDGLNAVTETPLAYTMLDGNVLNAGTWYIIDGIINPSTGDNTSYSGSIRNALGEKIGEIQNVAMPVGSEKLVLGWTGASEISRMKLAKITADTLTGSYATTDYVNTTTIDGGRITTGKIQSANGNTYFDLANNQIKIENTLTGFELDSQAAGLDGNGNPLDLNDPSIKGAYIDGGYIRGSTLESTIINANNMRVISDNYPSNFSNLSISTSMALPAWSSSSSINGYTQAIRLYGQGYGTGLIANRVSSNTALVTIEVGAYPTLLHQQVLSQSSITFSFIGASSTGIATRTNTGVISYLRGTAPLCGDVCIFKGTQGNSKKTYSISVPTTGYIDIYVAASYVKLAYQTLQSFSGFCSINVTN